MRLWKGIYFAYRTKAGKWERNHGDSIPERLSRFVDHPPLVERLKGIIVGTYGVRGSPNPQNTLQLLERAFERIGGEKPIDRTKIEGIVDRLEMRKKNLYAAIREEGGL